MRPISRKQSLFVASMVFSALSFMVMAPACRGEDNADAKPEDGDKPLGNRDDLAPLLPAHARLLSGRRLFIDRMGAAHVKIAPAHAVRLTPDLLPVTFEVPLSEQEAIEIAKILHRAETIVPSREVVNKYVAMLEAAGSTRRVGDEKRADPRSFFLSEGGKFGETVTKSNDSFFVTLCTVVVSSGMGATVEIAEFRYDFHKNGTFQHAETILVGPVPLSWQTELDITSKPNQITSKPNQMEIGQIYQKLLDLCVMGQASRLH